MKKLTYTLSNDIDKLHDEIIAGVPALAPRTPDTPDPVRPNSKEPVMTVHALGDVVTLDVPNDADESAIKAVIDAHDGTPPAAFSWNAASDAERLEELRKRLGVPD
jgi:hypothetical protein